MKTILLVDDSVMLRMTFRKALSDAGYTVYEADSGVKALALARKHLPDLILSDVHMPGGDGSTLLRDIRNDPELRGKQVVLMTGRPELMTPRRGMEEGADDFLLKPVSLDVLMTCVQTRFRRASINWRVEDAMLSQLRSLVPPQLPHELFTPLTGILGLVEILRSCTAPFSPEELKEIYDDIYYSALRLNRTQRNYLLLLDLKNAAPEGVIGTLSPEQVEAAIRAGLTEALRLNKRADDLTVRIHPCPIAVKPTELTRMVEELVDNAFKFSRHGTPVTVELTPEGHLIVTDQGRGLTPDQIEKIGVFQQFDKDQMAQQGLGLGLILVHKLATLSGSHFSLESQPGQGTRAILALAGTELPKGAQPIPADSRKRRVLSTRRLRTVKSINN